MLYIHVLVVFFIHNVWFFMHKSQQPLTILQWIMFVINRYCVDMFIEFVFHFPHNHVAKTHYTSNLLQLVQL